MLTMFIEFPTTIDELHAVFDVIDVTNSGKIDYKQFTDALCYKRQTQVFIFRILKSVHHICVSANTFVFYVRTSWFLTFLRPFAMYLDLMKLISHNNEIYLF